MANTTGTLISLAKTALKDEHAAVELMIQLRWPNGVACPRCGGADPYRLNRAAYKGHPPRRGLFKCSQCRKQFTVTTGTVFEASHIKLSVWLMAIHLMSASKKGMSALQLQRMTGVTYRAAWFMNHRLRLAMAVNPKAFGKMTGTLEADECYVGGSRKYGRGRIPKKTKTAVFALVERGGRAIAFPMQAVNSAGLQDAVRLYAAKSADLMTDEHRGYESIDKAVNSHNTVKHSAGEYVRGKVHTNTVEGFFSLLKRGITGTFHHVSKGHLHRYCDEFAFRYSRRDMTDGERAAQLVLNAEGRRLTYKSGTGDFPA